MQRIVRTRFTLIAIGFLPALNASSALAGSPDCTSFHGTSGLRVCVQFDSLPATPEEGTDHAFNFDANGIPSVEFLNGRDSGGTLMEWRVWSEDNTGAAGDIINLTAFGDFDYDVKILDSGSNAGANDVTNIDLNPSVAGDYSSVTDGRISGSLGSGGLSVQKSTGGTGGGLGLVIEGNQTGSITADTLLRLEVQGDSSGDITIVRAIDPTGDVGGIEIQGDVSGTIDVENYETIGHFTVGGDLAGPIDIETWNPPIPGSKFLQTRAVTSTGSLRIGTITNPMEIALTDRDGVYDFAGSLVIEDDIDLFQTVFIHGEMTSAAFVDLKNHNVAGTFVIMGGGAGEIRNVGQVLSGAVVGLAQFANTSFNGTATVGGVAAGGSIEARNGTSVGGTITVNGAMAGTVDIDGSLSGTLDINGASTGTLNVVDTMSGTIDVEGHVAGVISVGGDAKGDILVGGDLEAKIDIGGNLSGDIKVGGDANFGVEIVESIMGNGRILINGILSGDITIEKKTVGGSLIRATDGLAANATVIVNNSRGPHDAGGAMYFGDASSMFPVPTTFDGNVLVKDCDQAVHSECSPTNTHGLLLGGLTVRGCHATTDDLDICICGFGFQLDPLILQGGCVNQVAAGCTTGCP